MKILFRLALIMTGGLALMACEPASSPVTPTPTATVAPSPTALPRAAVSTSTIENKDGSATVVTTYNDGTKTEVRTFKTGKLARVTRTTDASGTRTVHVSYRADDADVEIKDESWIEKSMDATGDALAVAADKTKSGLKTAARETADKAEDVGDATKKGAKKVASETADKAEDVGDAVKKGAKKTAKKVKEVIKP